jgi:DNA-directed RNA polymerase subunit E'/Rpb7
MKDLKKFIATTIKEYLNENNSTQIYYHITPLVNVLKIKKEGIKMGDGNAGKGVYLSKTLKEALTWKNIFDTENEYEGRYINHWYVIEIINLDESKIDKGDEFDMGDGDFYYTEWVYRDDIPKENIKAMYVI